MNKQSIWQELANHHDTLSATHDAIRELFQALVDYDTDDEVEEVAYQPVAAAAPSALELFTGQPAAPQGEPVYTMLVNDFTREQYHAAQWTDEMLVSNGKMTITYPNAAPPTPPAAPSAPTTNSGGDTPTPAATNLLKDKSGMPWDPRIHSGGRTMTKDELWTKKKGVSPALVAQVTSELLAAKPAGGAPFAPVPAALAPAAPPAAPAAPGPANAPAAPAAPGTAKEVVAQALAAAAAGSALPTTFKDATEWLKANNLTIPQAIEAAQIIDTAIEGWGFLARPEFVGKIPEIIQLMKDMHGK